MMVPDGGTGSTRTTGFTVSRQQTSASNLISASRLKTSGPAAMDGSRVEAEFRSLLIEQNEQQAV